MCCKSLLVVIVLSSANQSTLPRLIEQMERLINMAITSGAMQSLPAPALAQSATAQNAKDNMEAVMSNKDITVPSPRGDTGGEVSDGNTSHQAVATSKLSVGI